jgi:hypothetical protein
LLVNGRKKSVVVGRGYSFANREQRIIARDASKEVGNIIFLEPFLVAADI